jgi:hypothetical protein
MIASFFHRIVERLPCGVGHVGFLLVRPDSAIVFPGTSIGEKRSAYS